MDPRSAPPASVPYPSLDAFLAHEETYLVLQQLADQARTSLGYDDAAVLLESDGDLGLAASTSETTKVFESWHLERDEPGPCREAFRTRRLVCSPDLADGRRRWPGWTAGAEAAGYRCGAAAPLLVDGRAIGALTLLGRVEGLDLDQSLAGLFAQLAAVAIMLEGRRRTAEELAGQLQHALDARTVVEQAKGVLVERHRITPVEAFGRLRRAARGQRRSVAALSAAVVAGTETV